MRDNGILVLLGPPTAAGEQMQVGINSFVACLGASWSTHVVTQNADGWVITGKTGLVAISWSEAVRHSEARLAQRYASMAEPGTDAYRVASNVAAQDKPTGRPRRT